VLQAYRATTVGNYEKHQITVLYDHLSRPMRVLDYNTATGKTRLEELYWDARDQLVERVTTPDTSVTNTYNVDMYAHVDPAVTGSITRQYASGVLVTDTHYYTARDPLGLPIGTYKFTTLGANTTVDATASWSPFGEVLASGGPVQPFRFHGQYALAGTQSERWNGNVVQQLRAPLVANMWRVYDTRVGQFLSPDLLTTIGGRHSIVRPLTFMRGYEHAYDYTIQEPYDFADPLGLWAVGVSGEVSTINPFTSGGGFIYGINLEYTSDSGWHLYKFATPDNTGSLGLLLGPNIQANAALGNGDWSGEFEGAGGSLNNGICGGAFWSNEEPWSSDEPGYFGLSGGWGLGPAGLGVTTTNYTPMW